MKKKFYSILLVLAALVVGTPTATAGWVFTGGDDADPTPAANLQPGMSVVLEAVSVPGKYVSRRGGYRATLDSMSVWVLEDAGKNATTNEQQYYLRNLGYGGYYTINNDLTSDKNNAAAMLFHSSTAGPVEAGGFTLDFSASGAQNAKNCTMTNLEIADGAATVYFYRFIDFMGFAQYVERRSGDRTSTEVSVRQVEWEVNLQADLAEAIAKYEASDYNTTMHSDINPFAVKDSVYAALEAAYKTAFEEVGNDHTNEEFQTYLDNLNEAMAAVDNANNVNPMTDGYYYIVTANNSYTQNTTDPSMASMAMYADEGNVKWSKIGAQDSALYIWHFTGTDNGYVAQNMGNGAFMDGPKGNSTSDADRQIVTTSSQNRTLDLVYRRRGNITIQTVGYNGSMRYFNQDGGNGTRTSGNVNVFARGTNDATAWHLVTVTDTALISRLQAELPQRTLTGQFVETLDEAEDLVFSNQPAYQPTGDKLVTAATQITTNNPEQSEGTTANGGGYEGLLDGDLNTYYHAAWNGASETDQNYNYIQVHLESGLPTNIAIWWARRISNNNNRPTSLLIQTSTDGTTWTDGQTLSNPEGRFPTLAADTFYTSPNITLPEGQTYLRLSVLHTAPVDRYVVEPYPYFTMSEFNLYPGSKQEFKASETQAARPDVKPSYDSLRQAYTTAAAVDAKKATQADIDALQKAIDGFKAVLADTTLVTTALSNAQTELNAASVGDGYGQFPQSAVDALKDVVANVNAVRPLYNYTRAQVDSLAGVVNAGIAAFKAGINLPEDGIYYIVSNSSAENIHGRIIYAQSYSVTSSASWGGLVSDNNDNSRAGWLFKSLGDGTFTLQNVGNGGYMGTTTNLSRVSLSRTPVAYELVPLGDGETALRPAVNGVKLDAYSNSGLYAFEENGGGKGSPCSWSFEAVNAGFNEHKRYLTNRAYVVTVPYNTYETPRSVEGDANVTFYDVVGTTKSQSGAITGLNLKEREVGLKAGEPVVLVVTSEDDETFLSMQLDLENLGLTNEPGTANGVHGVFSTYTIGEAGYGYFTAGSDTLQVTTEDGVDITRQEGYVVFGEVENVEGVTPDLVLPIAGDGVVNGIGRVTTNDPTAPVNVYSVDGVLLKKAVPAAKATQGLGKGLYIVAGKKVLVK